MATSVSLFILTIDTMTIIATVAMAITTVAMATISTTACHL